MLRILTDDRRQIALAHDLTPLDGSTLVMGRVVEGKGQLLEYYFGEGRKAVVLDLGPSEMRANLQTRWLGAERQWMVRVPPIPESADKGLPAR